MLRLVKTLAACAGLTAAVLTTTACTNKPDVLVPDGWKRIDVRQGLYSAEPALINLNFRANMPTDWQAFDAWGNPGEVNGSILLSSDAGTITYSIVPQANAEAHTPRFNATDAFSVWTEQIDGVETTFWQTKDASRGIVQAGALFPSIPGAPGGLDAALVLNGYGIPASLVDQVHALSRSVRFTDKFERPDDPPIAVTPTDEWVRLGIGSAVEPQDVFVELRAPHGWSTTVFPGFDSTPALITNGTIKIKLDMGGNHGCGPYPGSGANADTNNTDLKYWEEDINGQPFYFHRPAAGAPGTTGACIPMLPPERADGHNLGMGVNAEVSSSQDQELVLAIIRTFRNADW